MITTAYKCGFSLLLIQDFFACSSTAGRSQINFTFQVIINLTINPNDYGGKHAIGWQRTKELTRLSKGIKNTRRQR